MDQIRPIGPIERDIEPVFRVQRTSDDRDRPDPHERPPQEQQRRPAPPPPDDEPPEGGGSLIDVRV